MVKHTFVAFCLRRRSSMAVNTTAVFMIIGTGEARVKNALPHRSYAATFNGSSSFKRLTVAGMLPSAS